MTSTRNRNGSSDHELLDLVDLDHAQALQDRPGPERVRDWLAGGAWVPESAAGHPAPPPLSTAQISPHQDQDQDQDHQDLTPDPAHLLVAAGGTAHRLRVPQGRMFRPGGGKRRPIRDFTPASRRALLHRFGQIDQDKFPATWWRFVTLSYPEGYPSAAASKKHLDQFIKRLVRAYGPRGLIWKLEAQRRGAPHYHLLVLMGSPENHQAELEWVAHAWHELVGAGDRNHLRVHLGLARGSRPCVELLNSYGQAQLYAAKYLGKLPAVGEVWDEPGRFWGVRSPKLLPRRIIKFNLSGAKATLLKRQLRRYLERQPTGRYRIEHHGLISRDKLTRKQAHELQAEGLNVRPYHRRKVCGSCGGIAVLGMRSETLGKLEAWAQREIETWVPF